MKLSKPIIIFIVSLFAVAACTQFENQASKRKEPSIAGENDSTSTGPEKPSSPQSEPVLRQQSFSGSIADSIHNGISAGIAPDFTLATTSFHQPAEPVDRENYAHYSDNPVKIAAESPVSTFSIDVDTGSYSNVRRILNTGRLPPKDSVRSEEMINYFSYDYPSSDSSETPFEVFREIASTPWNPDTYLLHIGIKGFQIPIEKLPASNLVFLVDVSGSMKAANKLELLKASLKLLTQKLDANDTVSIVVYAGASGVVLEPTAGNEKNKIIASLDRLRAGGSTHGSDGIRLAYALAEQSYKQDGINRVLLATDGDFNVGTVNVEQLKDLIEDKRKSGIALSTLGFGSGNYNDHLMEQLADVGNGNYAYIDTLGEAQKVLVEELSATMLVIAKDVKIQIEFNPYVVAEYRLVGYENRMLKREDFNNDKVDAGEIGAGHTVTALYEIAMAGGKGLKMDPLRYQTTKEMPKNKNDEIAWLRLRFKSPLGDTSDLLEWPIKKDQIITDYRNTSNAFRFSAAVAAFAQQLRGGSYTGVFDYSNTATLANSGRGQDAYGYRSEFIKLVNLADSLQTPDKKVSFK